MKNKKVMVFLCITLIFLITFCYNIMPILADSGFDSSFDSDFDSSFDSDSSSDGGSGGLFYLVYLCFEYPLLGIIVLAIIIALLYFHSKKAKEVISKALTSKLELLDVSKYPEEKQLEIEAFNIYKQIQYAWMNFDEETIRKCTTDEMYNMYLMQLDTLKVKNQKNLMYDIKYLGSNIKKKEVINGQETIIMEMRVSCHDFIYDTKANKVVRGSSSKVNYYTYELTYVKTVNTKENSEDICPSCGAPVKGNNSGVCEYCRSTLISKNYTLILSKKKMISQR